MKSNWPNIFLSAKYLPPPKNPRFQGVQSEAKDKGELVSEEWEEEERQAQQTEVQELGREETGLRTAGASS